MPAAASEAQTIDLTVNPVAETPVLTASAAASGHEDTTVALTITAPDPQRDAEAALFPYTTLFRSSASLNHGTLNVDGSYTLNNSTDLVGLTLHAGDND